MVGLIHKSLRPRRLPGVRIWTPLELAIAGGLETGSAVGVVFGSGDDWRPPPYCLRKNSMIYIFCVLYKFNVYIIYIHI